MAQSEIGRQYIDLLLQKSAAIERALTATKNAVFDENSKEIEKESQNFADLYEKRENIITMIESIDYAISTFDIQDITDGDFLESIANINKKIQSNAKEIVELDKINIEKGKKISAALKTDIKEIRQNRAANNRYYSDDFLDSEGHFIDKKN